MDKNKIAYDLALICTQRYMEEYKRGEEPGYFVFSSGEELAEKAADTFRIIYNTLRRSTVIPSID